MHFQGKSNLSGIAIVHDNQAVAQGHGFHLIIGNIDAGNFKILLKVSDPDCKKQLYPAISFKILSLK